MPKTTFFKIVCSRCRVVLERGALAAGPGASVKLALNTKAAQLRHQQAKPDCRRALVEGLRSTVAEPGRA